MFGYLTSMDTRKLLGYTKNIIKSSISVKVADTVGSLLEAMSH